MRKVYSYISYKDSFNASGFAYTPHTTTANQRGIFYKFTANNDPISKVIEIYNTPSPLRKS